MGLITTIAAIILVLILGALLGLLVLLAIDGHPGGLAAAAAGGLIGYGTVTIGNRIIRNRKRK